MKHETKDAQVSRHLCILLVEFRAKVRVRWRPGIVQNAMQAGLAPPPDCRRYRYARRFRRSLSSLMRHSQSCDVETCKAQIGQIVAVRL